MQVYAGLPIITNQPPADLAARVPHHLVGFVEPGREFSAAEYAKLAHETIDGLLERGRRVVVEGGSGLYVRAALGGLDFGPAPNQSLHVEMEGRLAAEGVAALAAELERLDRELAATIDLANPRRVLRALEALASRRSAPAMAQADRLWEPGSRYEHALVALTADREPLRRRIDERVDQMVADGAVEELRAVRAAGPISRTLQQAIGVREFCACLDGEMSLDEATAQTKLRTRQLVRRQLTWMRKLPDAARIAVAGDSPGTVAARVAARLGT